MIKVLVIVTGITVFMLFVRLLAVNSGCVLSSRGTRVWFRVHGVIAGLLLLTVGMSFWDIYWRGYNSTTHILLFTTVSGLALYWFHQKEAFAKTVRKALLILSLLGTPITVLITWFNYERTDYSVYYNDDKYRLETTFQGILAPALLPDLFVKNGLIEQRYKLKGHYMSKDEIQYIQITSGGEKSIVIFHHSADTGYGLTNPLIIKAERE